MAVSAIGRQTYGNRVDRSRPCQFSKTKLCRFELLGRCTKGAQCSFAHGAIELRDEPDLRCTKLCTMMLQTGSCNKKDCNYAHNKSELRSMGNQSDRKIQRCRYELMGAHCAFGSKCSFAHSKASESKCAHISAREEAGADRAKLPLASALAESASLSLDDAPPPLPPLPPFASDLGSHDSMSDLAPPFAADPGWHSAWSDLAAFFKNVNDFSSGPEASYTSYAPSLEVVGGALPTTASWVDVPLSQPAYVHLAAPDTATQRKRLGESDAGVKERHGDGFNFGLDFLDADDGGESAQEESKFLSWDRADMIQGRTFGWPTDQPAMLNGVGCSVDGSKTSNWRVNKSLLSPVDAPQVCEMRSSGSSGSTLCTLGDGDILQQATSIASPEFGCGVLSHSQQLGEGIGRTGHI